MVISEDADYSITKQTQNQEKRGTFEIDGRIMFGGKTCN
jgi:hypothetical protein